MPRLSLPTLILHFRWRKAPPISLPDELLLAIFQHVAYNVDTATSYEDLLALQLVCSQWSRVARAVLYSWVELARSDDAAALERTLEASTAAGRSINIDSLVISAGYRQVEGSQLNRLLVLAPGIHKLVVFVADHIYFPRSMEAPEQLSLLTSLLDVTIVPSSVMDFPISFGLEAYLRQLPSQVRFLHLPGDETVPWSSTDQALAFKLYGLTVQEYPSQVAEWVLARSGSTLQYLTTASITNISRLASRHPNLRSLRILGRRHVSPRDFSSLRNLERLEIRARNVLQSIVETFPSSLRYLRSWSNAIAWGLEQIFSSPTWRDALPSLQTIVWDYWPVRNEVKSTIINRLEVACRENRIEFRSYPRTEQGEKATEGHDAAYEAFLRTSCCNNAPEQHAPIFLPPSLRSSTTRLPTRILSNLLANQVPIQPFLETTTGEGPESSKDMPVITDYFDGHQEWVTSILPRERLKLAARRAPVSVHTVPRPPPQRIKSIRENLAKVWLPFFLISSASVFITAMALYFTILRDQPALRVAVTFGSAVLLQVLRASVYLLPKHNDLRDGSSLLVVVMLYTWPLSVLTMMAAGDGDSLTTGLGFAGGGSMLFFGFGIIILVA